jgi:hypothetical protein
MRRIDRAVATIVGSAVGDALGTPFEFGPPGAFSARFPEAGHGGEMCGGGGWEPGEGTEDTHMAVVLAESRLQGGGLDLPDIFARFQRWATAGPKDIGLQTEDVLTNGMPWDLATAIHFQLSRGGRQRFTDAGVDVCGLLRPCRPDGDDGRHPAHRRPHPRRPHRLGGHGRVPRTRAPDPVIASRPTGTDAASGNRVPGECLTN